ncbi:hypothetical protein EC968_003162 [Mortierella alpina]|nr:hypothetical protein EC968_003162 [Mortierella alpina]
MSKIEKSIEDATTATNIMEIVQEATRMILSPLIDLRSVQKAYQQTMKRLLDYMAAQVLTLQQLNRISEAFETCWMRRLQLTSVYDQDSNVTSNAGSTMKEYLLVQPLSSPSQVLQMKYQTHLLFSQLLTTLKVIRQKLENRRNAAPCERDVEMTRASQSARSPCEAKARMRQERVHRALESRHRQWQSDQDLAWLVAVAVSLDRDCVRNLRMIQSQGDSDSSELDEVMRRSEDICRDLMTQVSSFAANAPGSLDRSCPSPPPSWCQGLLVKMISSSDLARDAK